jgi:uncharacterized protein (DUF3084 family)
MYKVVIVLAVVAVLFGCSKVDAKSGKYSLPEPYRSQIVKLRADNIALEMQQQDLQKQLNNLSVQYQFNNQRAKTIVNEAAQHLGISVSNFNIDTLELEGK